MTKKLATLGIILIVLMGGLITPVNVSADHCKPGEKIQNQGRDGRSHGCVPVQPADPGQEKPSGGFSLNPIDIARHMIDSSFKALANILITLTSFILIISGLLFDFVIKFTILEVSKNLADSGGIGQSITGAWQTIRDIANMFFIFVLIWTAFKAMFELSFAGLGGAIKNIIIIALLINFSLFFSKVVIDASNIAALGFYKSIVNQKDVPLINSSGINTTAVVKGISGGYMNMLGIQNLLNANILQSITSPPNILLTGFVISAFMLIISVVFIITSIMFISRFVILIFLMILSPLAFVAYMVPAMKNQFDKWREALISQSFFAPLFFALTWVVFKIGNGLKVLIEVNNNTRQAAWADLIMKPDQAMILVLNYTLMIGFSIAALVFAKQMASKTPGFSQISSGITSTTAFAGRNTIGRAGNMLSQSAILNKASKDGNVFTRPLANMALYASKTARSASFDARKANIPTSVLGDVVRGTVGQTNIGKKLGLNEFVTDNIDVAEKMVGSSLGTAGTKGYKETKEETRKKLREEESKSSSEQAIILAQESILAGAKAPAGSPLIGDMEKALAKLSDKETETLVANNRELLKSLNFANAISVKQLEAINKSDQFSEEEKGHIKAARFSKINMAMAAGGAGATSVHKEIRGLSDTELEMIDSAHIRDADFVSQMKSSQVEFIGKSNKFTTNQKDELRSVRRKPLADALVRKSSVDIQKAIKNLGPKEVASLDMAILKMPTMIEAYISSFLKRMAPEMNPTDILELRDEILRQAALPGASPNLVKLEKWLNSPDGAIFS